MYTVPQPPPPPPPPPLRTPDSSLSSRPQARRYPHAPPSIVTNVAPSTRLRPEGPASAVTPWTAGPLGSFASPLSPATSEHRTPAMSYNPQEWGRAVAAPGSYMPHTATQARGTAHMTGMEARMPEPPPPYSASSSPAPQASRSVRTSPYSTTFGQPSSSASSPQDVVAQTPVSASARPIFYSPQTQSPPSSFPPPPSGQRDRSGSRTRGVLNTLSAFASRQRQNETASPVLPPVVTSRQRSGTGLRQPTPPESSYAASPPEQLPAPPSGRRSVSAGLPSSASETRDSPRNRPVPNWQPGMPLPPPPPVPPPASRSQSADRTSTVERNGLLPSIQSPKPIRFLGTRLGPVPPTPADWVEDSHSREREALTAKLDTPPLPLHAETWPREERLRTQYFPDQSNISVIEPQVANASSNVTEGAFGRLPPRDSSTKGIRERRMETRARQGEPQTAVEPTSINPWAETRPANLTLPSGNAGPLGRMKHASKPSPSPRSAAFSATPDTAGDGPTSAKSTSSEMGDRSRVPLKGPASLAAMTPPFSPESEETQKKRASAQALSAWSSAALPTPPSTTVNSGRSLISDRSGPPSSGDIRNSERPKAITSPKVLPNFFQASLDRYRLLLENEAAASNDRARLELFSQFFVSESRLRRDRYSKSFAELGTDVMDLTRDLWRSNNTSKGSKVAAPRLDTSTASQTRIATSQQDPSSASSQGSTPFTPATEQDSPGSNSSTGPKSAGEFKRFNSYKPALSPILSMAQSTVTDEEGSRGRAPSRWWDKSNSGDSIGNGGRKIERTKRESKYMGFSRQNLENLQWEPESSPAYSQGQPGPSNYAFLGPNEYPVEKVGWHEENTPKTSTAFRSEPPTPQPHQLDVSRLITLPPPYPRHHPAVNNKHPELSSLRQELRSISDDQERTDLRGRFEVQRTDTRIDSHAIAQRRQENKHHIQVQVSEGKMSFAEAAQAEGAFEELETKRFKNLTKANFNLFTKTVFQPLSAILDSRITTATGSINLLRASLLDSAAAQNPNAMQESGDELPELLERVTLMKWFFEARETLHKDVFELQSQSDELYKEVILAPYRLASNKAKEGEVEAFFATDMLDRRVTFAQEAIKRIDDFHATVDESVNRGVEAQISAFWDIAPPLLEVVEKVPADTVRLSGFEIQIPAVELEENPSYEQYPMQYLYTLLEHAEKSSYQFIESQTNLFCLLHEVNLGVMGARLRVLQCRRQKEAAAVPDAVGREIQMGAIEAEVNGIREREDKRLTRELKERAQVVEEQWKSTLGGAMSGCRRRVGDWLVSVGGWDEGFEE